LFSKIKNIWIENVLNFSENFNKIFNNLYPNIVVEICNSLDELQFKLCEKGYSSNFINDLKFDSDHLYKQDAGWLTDYMCYILKLNENKFLFVHYKYQWSSNFIYNYEYQLNKNLDLMIKNKYRLNMFYINIGTLIPNDIIKNYPIDINKNKNNYEIKKDLINICLMIKAYDFMKINKIFKN
jgi:hypothetical protein